MKHINNSVIMIIDSIGRKPIIFKFCNLVFVPTAPMAINKNQELISLNRYLILVGIKFNEFIITTRIKKIIKYGISGVFLSTLLISFNLYDIIEIIRTIGNNNVTLNNLITVAVSPVISETVKPAPITCATSWMVAPKKIPADISLISKYLLMIG